MASQTQTCLFILTCSLTLVLWLISQADHASANNLEADEIFKVSSANDSGDKVKLSVYYESLCPYCANFIVNHLVKIFQTDLINIVNLRLVPWGNTHISPNNSWICQHGVDECQLDVTEACAINAWPRMETHFRFIYCIERLHLMNKHTEWQSCFGATGFDRRPLDSCYNNGLGHKLEKAYADETGKLNPRHRFVPWVVINSFPLQEDYQNFIAYICKAYRGSKTPTACKSRSFEINSSKAATATPQVSTLEELKT
ncbi:hypothetical protein BUALT_Bualt11G0133000 [Buddleja alternifolia]|uniref:Gamma-interferon-inducible lysosomal thiol reductase n=1 Tax=Buddleja alternifolia TaxID=168488 RepID=A0AAV6WW50_9LAMI|nr:hypothetical protein BUALT_Bualt11G0133000 [Buddleja alternifolia]